MAAVRVGVIGAGTNTKGPNPPPTIHIRRPTIIY